MEEKLNETENETVDTVETTDKAETEQAEPAGADHKKDKRAVKVAEKKLAEAEKALDDARKEKEELNDTYLRMLAEYDNFRKRAQKEKDAMYAEGVADAVEKLLPVLDNLERAAATDVSSADAASVAEGVKKILEQANEVFGKLGVTEIPAMGEPFDPERHNAVMHEENEDYGENVISDVFMKGYTLGDKVIRHSVVKVMN